MAPAAAPETVYKIASRAAPSWYLPGPSPTVVVTCSSQVVSTDCTVPKLTTGITPIQDGNPITISIAVTGVASPTAADIGTTATITGTGTAQYPALGPNVRPALGETLFSVVGS